MKSFYILGFIVFLGMHALAAGGLGISFAATAYKILAVSKKTQMLIPITYDLGVAPGKFTPDKKPALVCINNVDYNAEYTDAFEFRLTDDKKALLVTVDLLKLRWTGTYEVVVTMADSTRKLQQDFHFLFTRPPVVLQSVQKVNIKVENGEVISSDLFQLLETGKQSSIFNTTIPSPVFPGIGIQDLVTFQKDTETITAGQLFKEALKVHTEKLDKIAYGTYTGTLTFSPDAAASPVTVDFVLTYTNSKYLIFVCLLLGLVVGYIVRVLLKNKTDLEEKRVEGFDLIDSIEAQRAKVQDADFRTSVDAIVTTLRQTLTDADGLIITDGRPLKTVSDAITAAQTGYATATSRLTQGLTEMQLKLSRLASVFDGNPVPALRNELTDAEKAFQAAVNALANSDVKGARQFAGTAVAEIKGFIRDYAGNVGTTIKELKDGSAYPKQTPPAVAANVQLNAGRLGDILNGIQPTDDEGGLVVMTQSIANLQHNLANLIAVLIDDVTTAFHEDYDDTAGTPQMAKFKQAFDAWVKELQRWLSNPVTVLDTSKAANLSDSWPAAAAKGMKEIQALDIAAFSQNNLLPWEAITGGSVWHILQGNAVPASLAATSRGARRNFLFFSILQSALLLLVMSLAAYQFYAPSYIGKPSDLVGIFLLAFSLDISVASVNQLRGQHA